MELFTPSLPKDILGNKESSSSVLWIPHPKIHPIVKVLDWISGMTISDLKYKDSLQWSDEIKTIINEEALPLDEKPSSKQQTFLITLPKGLKCHLALLVPSCDWESPKKVYERYSKISSALKPSKVQALHIWNTPAETSKGIEWVKV